MGFALGANNTLNLSELGFLSRHHVPRMTDEEHIKLEVSVGARLLAEAADVNGWDPAEIEAVLVGVSIPVADDFVERIAAQAGIPDSALKVTVHKACDGSVGALNLALNPELAVNKQLTRNLAERLYGKKILVGGIEGLSRVLRLAHDAQAAQLFGNGAGIFGLIPGQTMKFLVGTTREAYDEEGALQVHMAYPHSRQRIEGQSLIEVAQTGENSIRVAGLMHEPEDPTSPVVMAGPMGMVKLFVRNGVEAVRTAYQSYRAQMIQLGLPDKDDRRGDRAPCELQDQPAQGKAVAQPGHLHPDALAVERVRQRQRGVEYDRVSAGVDEPEARRSCAVRRLRGRQLLRCAGRGVGRVAEN